MTPCRICPSDNQSPAITHVPWNSLRARERMLTADYETMHAGVAVCLVCAVLYSNDTVPGDGPGRIPSTLIAECERDVERAEALLDMLIECGHTVGLSDCPPHSVTVSDLWRIDMRTYMEFRRLQPILREVILARLEKGQR